MEEYNLIVSESIYKLIRKGAKRATTTFERSYEVHKYLGWLLVSRDCKIYLYRADGSVERVIESRRQEVIGMDKPNIVQVKNPKTGHYVKIDKTEGKILSHKATSAAYKNVPIVGGKK